ncbi:unnamed protein product [Paramecium pentaurelia]|uniref:Uncharacterized protein n=1 Tax=Paramecium pentaurelia TaxID=43138 RepID=A0A8S1TLT3_9CILI|nr:unnamed protein product [Paramecium pentaurelia]
MLNKLRNENEEIAIIINQVIFKSVRQLDQELKKEKDDKLKYQALLKQQKKYKIQWKNLNNLDRFYQKQKMNLKDIETHIIKAIQLNLKQKQLILHFIQKSQKQKSLLSMNQSFKISNYKKKQTILET